MRMQARLLLIFGLVALAIGLAAEARKPAQVELGPKELYQKIARAQVRLQIVDVREDYEEMHIPGAIPFPGCDPSAASEWMIDSAPTVIVSDDGDAELFERCKEHFTSARNLTGGMTAWDDENYPEDEGEYLPPSSRAGGGCL